MTQPDPFAAAQSGVRNPVPPAQSAGPDAFTPATDMNDPFLTSSDVRGDYTPSPGLENIEGRLVVMIPRTFDPAAKDPNDPTGTKTRELYTVDLTVLSGGKLEFPYKVKGDREKGTEDTYATFTVEDVSQANPFTIKGYWVPQGAIIGRLKAIHAKGAPYLGVPEMGPTKAQRDAGKTPAQVKAAYTQWVAQGKPGNRPSYSWRLVDPTPEQKAIAIAWWASVKSTIAPIIAQDNT